MNATNDTSSFLYLLIGSGRVARHLANYLNLLNIHFESWDRSQDPHALKRKLANATHVLLAISDQALEGFYRQHLAGYDLCCVHFSGALSIDGMVAAHPLMTFSTELYDLDFYKKIHFTLTGASDLQECLPGLSNPFSILDKKDKGLYHAHCVMGGNFSALLMLDMIQGMENLKIPAEAAELYLQKVFENVFKQKEKSLTGPLARKDKFTVDANLVALKDDDSLEIYKSFLKTYWPEYNSKK